MSEDFFISRNLDQYNMKLDDLGKLPFDLIYPDAIQIENFGRQEDCGNILFKYLIMYQESSNTRDSIIWRCQLCGFWCEVFDQRLMEQHLCHARDACHASLQ